MPDVPVPSERRQDPVGRDPARTPMPWNASSGRGFTPGKPWLPFGPPSPNVEEQRNDPGSLLSLYQEALTIRRKEPALHSGALHVVHATRDTLLFERTAPGSPTIFVALNTSAAEQRVELDGSGATLLLGTDPACRVDTTEETPSIILPGLVTAWISKGSTNAA